MECPLLHSAGAWGRQEQHGVLGHLVAAVMQVCAAPRVRRLSSLARPAPRGAAPRSAAFHTPYCTGVKGIPLFAGPSRHLAAAERMHTSPARATCHARQVRSGMKERLLGWLADYPADRLEILVRMLQRYVSEVYADSYASKAVWPACLGTPLPPACLSRPPTAAGPPVSPSPLPACRR